MTKVMIDVPDNLHRLVKSLASSKGETMKHFVLRSMEYLVKQEVGNSNISNSNQEFINEEEADNILKPYLLTLVDDIKNGKEKVINSKPFFNELAKS